VITAKKEQRFQVETGARIRQNGISAGLVLQQ
jgi:hypothetical protein